ncbi:MAG: type II toxin-antitoxin system VapC family toxin [Methanomassiliicoccales archaeon]|nr:MAG: type II toxin-antitoxin system VapC family toxin [Methanomassiliicoccales archaeon]
MFLDTNIIIDMLQSDPEARRVKKILELVGNESLFVSVFQIGELSDWSLKNGIDPFGPFKHLKETSRVIPLTESICVDASEIKHEMRDKGAPKFSLGDGLVLASARSIKQTLLTKDKDFKEAEDVIIL